MRTVRKVSGTNWPTLTRTNYDEWAVTMKVKFRARRLWNAIDKDTNNEEDMSALEAILAAVLAEYREPLGAKNSAKEAWEAIARDARRFRPRKEGDGPTTEAGVR